MNLFCSFFIIALFSLILPIASSGADIPRFDVNRYQVEGNSLLSSSVVDQTLAPFTGNTKDFGTIQQAVEALEQAYRASGYYAVKVLLPEQELERGVVRITILETRINSVKIKGNNYFDNDNIRRSLPGLQEKNVPNLALISKEIRVANENPARKMQLILESGSSNDIVNASLNVVDEKPWSVGVSLDNTGTDDTGNLRLGFLARHANLFNRDHLLTLQYTTSPEHFDKVSIYNLGYRIPLYSLGDSVDLYGGYSDVDSGAIQSGILSLNVSGKGTFAGFRYNRNLTRIGAYEHRLLFGFDYRRFENNIGYEGAPLDSITEALPVSIGYAGSKIFAEGSEAGGWLSISQNIPDVTSKDNNTNYRQVRIDSSSNFTIIRAGANLLYMLPADFQSRTAFYGQYTWQPLITGEQFGMGGQGSLRGFEEREFSDDMGVTGSLEFYTPNFLKHFAAKSSQLRALLFYDAGYLGRNKEQSGEETTRTAASTGIGLRLAIARHLTASSDYAIIVNPLGDKSCGKSMWHFSINVLF